jgi:hypothetical protein
MLVSGEDSITRAGSLELAEDVLFPLAAVELPLEEQAARPAARRPVAVSASTLLPLILLIVNFDLPSHVLRFRRGVVFSG